MLELRTGLRQALVWAALSPNARDSTLPPIAIPSLFLHSVTAPCPRLALASPGSRWRRDLRRRLSDLAGPSHDSERPGLGRPSEPRLAFETGMLATRTLTELQYLFVRAVYE